MIAFGSRRNTGYALFCITCTSWWHLEKVFQKSSTEKPSSATRVDFIHPVARAKVVFGPTILHLTRPMNYVMESGYVNISRDDYLFYFFCEAVRKVARSAPLLVWTNGGPGCSSMEGAFTEVGPLWLYDILKGQVSAGRLSENVYGWNNFAHLLFVDQPRQVGFSYGVGDRITSLAEGAQDFVQFMQNWLVLFPEHLHRSIMLSGESYGARYVAAWADAIISFNYHMLPGSQLPVVAIILVTGCLANRTNYWADLLTHKNRRSWMRNESMSDLMKKNHMDSRLDKVSDDGEYDYSVFAQWLSRDDVRSALHIPSNAGLLYRAGGHCTGPSFMNWNWSYDEEKARQGLSRALRHGINVSYMTGKQDILCSFPRELNVLNSLEWQGADGFTNSSLRDVGMFGAHVGQQKTFSVGGTTLTYLQVEMAGHMVPRDDPAASLIAFVPIGSLVLN